jgi:hypothetical protein
VLLQVKQIAPFLASVDQILLKYLLVLELREFVIFLRKRVNMLQVSYSSMKLTLLVVIAAVVWVAVMMNVNKHLTNY